jgi:hypothetical protein
MEELRQSAHQLSNIQELLRAFDSDPEHGWTRLANDFVFRSQSLHTSSFLKQ